MLTAELQISAEGLLRFVTSYSGPVYIKVPSFTNKFRMVRWIDSTSLGSNRRTLGKPIAKYFNAIAFYRFYPLPRSTLPLSIYIVNSFSDIGRSVASSIRAERNRTKPPFVSWNDRSNAFQLFRFYVKRKLPAVVCHVRQRLI